MIRIVYRLHNDSLLLSLIVRGFGGILLVFIKAIVLICNAVVLI